MLDSYKPPTDVLYKFMAVSGLVIFLAVGWRTTTTQLEEHRLEMLLRAKTIDYVLEVDRSVTADTEKAELQLRSEGVEPTREQLQNRYEEISKLKQSPQLLDGKSIKILNDELLALRIDMEAEKSILLDMLLPFGCTLMVWGFYLWYVKVQRHLDIILEMQANQVRATGERKQSRHKSATTPYATRRRFSRTSRK